MWIFIAVSILVIISLILGFRGFINQDAVYAGTLKISVQGGMSCEFTNRKTVEKLKEKKYVILRVDSSEKKARVLNNDRVGALVVLEYFEDCCTYFIEYASNEVSLGSSHFVVLNIENRKDY